MIYIIGGNGFVGSAYVRLFERLGLEHRVITRDTYEQHKGTSCDILINANGNSRKFMSTRDPVWDFDASVRSVVQSLEDFKAGSYVLLSSGDVYPEQHAPEVTREDQILDLSRISRYGLHKRMAEMAVQGVHRSWLVVRMGGFVGPGLKKNAIYDMQTGAPVWLSPDSELQFIPTDDAAALVWRLIGNGVRGETVNLGAEGLLRLGDLHARLGSASVFQENAPTIRYELSLDKLRTLAGGDLPRTVPSVYGFCGVVDECDDTDA